jgi:hypothetical protein
LRHCALPVTGDSSQCTFRAGGDARGDAGCCGENSGKVRRAQRELCVRVVCS